MSLWDVANVEAHVRTSLDAALGDMGARLNRAQHERAFAFLLALCWQLSGLEGDGKTLRFEWAVVGFIAPRGRRGSYEPIKLPQFPTRAGAEAGLLALAAERTLSLTRIEQVRPRGAYDKSFGLSFSTYSRRLLGQRLTDWYRSDTDFGDSRYQSSRRNEESLEALASRRQLADSDELGDYLERHGPGSRLEVVDELNPSAYQDSIQDLLTGETVGLRQGELMPSAAVSC